VPKAKDLGMVEGSLRLELMAPCSRLQGNSSHGFFTRAQADSMGTQSGMRVVIVRDIGLTHRYYPLGELPNRIDLKEPRAHPDNDPPRTRPFRTYRPSSWRSSIRARSFPGLAFTIS